MPSTFPPPPAAASGTLRFTAYPRDCIECSGSGEVIWCRCGWRCDHAPSDCGHCGGDGTARAFCGVCDATIGERGLTGHVWHATHDAGGACDGVVCSSAECRAVVVADAREFAGGGQLLVTDESAAARRAA